MPDHLFFYLGLAFLFTHELDAVRCKEWRIFPGLSYLNDRTGFVVFTLAHIPLIAWIFYEVSKADNEAFIFGFSIFMIVHLGLHVLFLMHPKNEFRDWVSWLFISGAAICGLLQLVI
jgi:hypothetical protein